MSAITVAQDPYNSRMVIDVTWTGPAEPVGLSRFDPDGVWRFVRQGNPLTLASGAWSGSDYECPMDVGVKYAIRSATSSITYSNSVLLQSQGMTWIKHPYRPSLNVRVYPTAAPDMTRTAPIGVFAILGRATPVAMTTTRSADVGTLTFATSVEAENVKIRNVFADGGIVQLAFPSGYGLNAMWVVANDVTAKRVTHFAPEETRMWELTFTAVERPN